MAAHGDGTERRRGRKRRREDLSTESASTIDVEVKEGPWKAFKRAVCEGDAHAVVTLLPRVDPNQRCRAFGLGSFVERPPIVWAAENGHVDVIRVLLADARVDPAAGDNDAVRLAAKKGHVDVVRVLLADARVDPAAGDNDAVRAAARNGHVDVVRVLLADARVDPAASDSEAVRHAASNGHVDAVRVLLADARVDPAADDNYAVRWAASNGRVDVVRVLLADARVDPAVDNYAVMWAAQKGHVDVVRVLLADARVDPADDDNNAVSVAAENGHVDVVRVLLADARVDPAAQDNEAVRWAAHNGHVDVVRVLLGSRRCNAEAVQHVLTHVENVVSKRTGENRRKWDVYMCELLVTALRLDVPVSPAMLSPPQTWTTEVVASWTRARAKVTPWLLRSSESEPRWAVLREKMDFLLENVLVSSLGVSDIANLILDYVVVTSREARRVFL